MPQGALTAFIVEYIAKRRQKKLETFDKEAAKRLAAQSADEQTLLQERRELELRYSTENWLSDAASRAGQISLVTHAAKYTHGDSKSSSIYSVTTVCEGYLSTATLDAPMADAVGNAAALDVAKLLQTEVQGDSLLACLQRGDYRPLQPLATGDEQLQHWIAGFNQALTTEAPTSHKLAKQIYFPVPEGYHLLGPLFSTSLAQAMHQKLAALRFGEEARAQWQARRNNQWHDRPLVSFPASAEMHFGGTKPQNISALNSSRGGRLWLLSARPPVWKRQEKAPQNLVSIFAAGGEFDRAATGTIRHVVNLLNGTGEVKNRHIRQARASYVDELIDRLFMLAGELQRPEWRGWSLQSPELKHHQQLWLDPWRGEDDEAFRQARAGNEWQTAIAADFARWFNARLRKRLPDVGKTERREWETRPLFRRRLREMEAILREELQ